MPLPPFLGVPIPPSSAILLVIVTLSRIEIPVPILIPAPELELLLVICTLLSNVTADGSPPIFKPPEPQTALLFLITDPEILNVSPGPGVT